MNVRAELEEDNINVFWEEPVNPNGIITEYNVSGNCLLCLHFFLFIFCNPVPAEYLLCDPKRTVYRQGLFSLVMHGIRDVIRGEEYSLWWPIRGGSARKGYLFQASGIWKGREICYLGLWKGPKGPTDEFYGFIKSRKRSIFVNDSYLKDSAFTALPAVKSDAKF